MNKTLCWAASVLLVAGLAGCSASTSTSTELEGVQPFSAPGQSSAPSPTPTEEEFIDYGMPGPGEPMSFMQSIRFIPSFSTINETDATALAHEVCAQLNQGVDPTTIYVGETDAVVDTRDAVWVSSSFFCAEHSDRVMQIFMDEHAANFGG